ncbi:beta-propeller fold lactonase family protein [Flaviaesturariibacter amylovorans]|uniref:YNCE-like beta-propeller domain-containing protein n=1 Tax=Flaviaesturariibacter amylovorans TaxID=1084520 RepID=A0ABP8HDA6_9BACT
MTPFYTFRRSTLLLLAGTALASSAIAQGCPATVAQPPSQAVCAGATATGYQFAGTGTGFTWTNSTPAIGLPASGSGNVAPFATVNTTNSPLTATLTVTPQSGAYAPNPYAYVPNKGNDNVSVYNTATNTVVTSIAVGDEPLSVQAAPDGMRVYIANSASDNVSVISTYSNTVIATVDAVDAPYGMALTPNGQVLYVANRDDHSISVINTITLQPVDTIYVGQEPVGLAVSPDGSRLYVCNSGSNSVSVINTADGSVLTTVANIGGAPEVLAVSPNGQRVYVSNLATDELTVIDATTNSVLTRIGVGMMPFGIAISADGARVYVTNFNSANIAVVNSGNNTVDRFIALPGNSSPAGISISPDGSRLFVTLENSGSLATVLTANDQVAANVTVGAMPVSLGTFVFTPLQPCNGTPRTFTITVNPTPRMAAPGNSSVCPDDAVAVAFNGTLPGSTFAWTNSETGTGLAASGTGDIVFTAVNSGSADLVSTISVTPQANGCNGPAQSFTIRVNDRPAAPTLTRQGATLVSSATTGNTWFVDNTQIPFIGTQTFTPTSSGVYSVRVNSNPCPSLFSNAINFVVTGINDPVLERNLSLGPIPAGDLLYLRTGGLTGPFDLRVLNTAGAELRPRQRITDNTAIGLAGLPAGTYIVEIQQVRTRARFVKTVVKR